MSGVPVLCSDFGNVLVWVLVFSFVFVESPNTYLCQEFEGGRLFEVSFSKSRVICLAEFGAQLSKAPSSHNVQIE
jgi:hypothetical protein